MQESIGAQPSAVRSMVFPSYREASAFIRMRTGLIGRSAYAARACLAGDEAVAA
jgi:hypothetical protein